MDDAKLCNEGKKYYSAPLLYDGCVLGKNME
jgi:hypothetical protein